ncbi:hypothetical protein [Nocardioides sp.]|uniref:hypothetical protein n=1 Tax=Nocardioides sp. TaxID=35761 RepID=UPI002C78A794|nr:hypothetical protein [Nocardioides sp.]HSX68512.1 hypothetical protein [Nocardioides sp.]
MPAGRELLESVYAFARARAQARLQGRGLDEERRRSLTSQLRHLHWAYAEAKMVGTDAALAAAIDVCRKAAMRDAEHPEYDPL